MAYASWSDVYTRRVSNQANMAYLLVGVAAQLSRGGWAGALDALAGVGVAFALVILPFAARLYRGGDAKFILATGAWLGPQLVAWMFLWGVALGGALALVLIATSGAELRGRIRRGLGASARTLTLPAVEEDRPAHLHVPMALAFAVGALIATVWWK
ncbi:A24 family peptidase [Myxococcota bacterium]|nr:A24 family peptidase [Myxococcota bacterium]MBU1432933.1 A24 family peptidase [Myxococcota bacterium]MBU1896235.1 A24 family peptidase [Myxococcota bacterium]